MQLKKVEPDRCNVSYNLKKTVNLHCANSNEQSKSNPFPNLRAQQSKFGKHSQTDRYIQMTNKTMLNIPAFNVLSWIYRITP